jgi:hypothetical protein
MKTKNRTVIHTLFPHADDRAYQKLAELEERVSTVKARRGTAPFKQRLQRAIVRVSEYLVEYSNDGDEAGREEVVLRALGDCRKAVSAIEMMFRGGAFTRETASTLAAIIADIAQILIDRVYELRGAEVPTPLSRPAFMETLAEATSGPTEDVGENATAQGPPQRMLGG